MHFLPHVPIDEYINMDWILYLNIDKATMLIYKKD